MRRLTGLYRDVCHELILCSYQFSLLPGSRASWANVGKIWPCSGISINLLRKNGDFAVFQHCYRVNNYEMLCIPFGVILDSTKTSRNKNTAFCEKNKESEAQFKLKLKRLLSRSGDFERTFVSEAEF